MLSPVVSLFDAFPSLLSSEILTLRCTIFFSWACTLQSKVSGSRCSPRLFCAAVFAGCVVTQMESSGRSSKIHKTTSSRNWVNSFSLGSKNVKGNKNYIIWYVLKPLFGGVLVVVVVPAVVFWISSLLIIFRLISTNKWFKAIFHSLSCIDKLSPARIEWYII